MSNLVVSLPPDLTRRLEVLAADMGSSVEDCAKLAVQEFLDSWEDHMRTIGEMDEAGKGPDFGPPRSGIIAEAD